MEQIICLLNVLVHVNFIIHSLFRPVLVQKMPNILSDDRFKVMFENPDFQVDEKSEEFRLLNPLVSKISEKRKKKLQMLKHQQALGEVSMWGFMFVLFLLISKKGYGYSSECGGKAVHYSGRNKEMCLDITFRGSNAGAEPQRPIATGKRKEQTFLFPPEGLWQGPGRTRIQQSLLCC